MARIREDREEKALTRGMILEVLQAAVDRERGKGESLETYLDEDLIYRMVGTRYPQTRDMLRGSLYYLQDKNFVKQKKIRIGKAESLMWRITAAGTDVLEGNALDAGVAVE